MPFPFSISKTITFAQVEKKITSDKYILNYLHQELKESLRMSTVKASNNEFTLLKTDFFRAFRKKDFLRNLTVKVQTSQSEIRVSLKSNTLIVFLFGLLPGVLITVQSQQFQLVPSCIFAGFIWGLGLLPRWIILENLKMEVKQHLRDLMT